MREPTPTRAAQGGLPSKPPHPRPTSPPPPLPPPLPSPLPRFYAPWCGHCKNLAPEYARAAEVFAASSATVLVAKFDADAHKETPTKFEVKGFPTLKWFPKGSLVPVDYEGERTADAIVAYVNAQTGLSKALKVVPSAVAALTPETFDTVVSAPATFKLLEFYAPWCGHCKQLAPVYEKLGAAFEGEAGVVIAKIDADKHRSLGERFGVEGFPTIKYLLPEALAGGAKPEAAAVTYDGPRDLEGMVKFVNEKAGTARNAAGGAGAHGGPRAQPGRGRHGLWQGAQRRGRGGRQGGRGGAHWQGGAAGRRLRQAVREDPGEGRGVHCQGAGAPGRHAGQRGGHQVSAACACAPPPPS